MKRPRTGVLIVVGIVVGIVGIWAVLRPRRHSPVIAPRAVVKTSPQPKRDTTRDMAELDALRHENQQLREALDRKMTTAGDGSQAKVARLRELFARLPDQAIPEFQLATDDDWYAAVDGSLDTTDDYRAAMARLRKRVEDRAASRLQPALSAYVAANHAFPQDPIELKAFLKEPLSDAILQRYRVAPASEVPNVRMGGDWIITQVARIDPDYDQTVVVGPNGRGTFTQNNTDGGILEPVVKAYVDANGRPPQNPGLLLPYATTPQQQAAVNRVIQKYGQR